MNTLTLLYIIFIAISIILTIALFAMNDNCKKLKSLALPSLKSIKELSMIITSCLRIAESSPRKTKISKLACCTKGRRTMQTFFKFPPDDYGRTLNMCDHTMQFERDAYCKRIGEPKHFPLSDDQHRDFEIEMSVKYRKEFIEYLKKLGGLNVASLTIAAMNKKSNLIEYYMERRRQNERKTALSVRHDASRSNDVA